MTRSSPNIPTGIKGVPVFPLVFLLAIAWGSGGCGLSKYVSFDFIKSQTTPSNDAYTRGLRYYKQGYYKSAVKELETVPPTHPNYKDARTHLRRADSRVQTASRHINHALAHQQQGELDKAKKEFEAALKVYPRHRRVQKLLQAVEYEIEARLNFFLDKGMEELERKRPREAREALLEVLKSDPHEERALEALSRVEVALVDHLLLEGLVQFEKGHLDAALDLLEESHQIAPNDRRLIRELPKVYNRRALKYYREEKLALAVADLKRSLEIDPDQREIRTQLKQVKTRMGLLKKIDP